LKEDKPTKQHPNEKELGERFRQGDEPAFTDLYLWYKASVERLVRKMPGMRNQREQHDLVDDIVQEAFVSAWTSRSTFNPDLASFSTWIHTIAKNICNRTLRLRGRYKKLSGEMSLDYPICQPGEDDAPLASSSILSGEDLGFAFTKGEEDYVPTQADRDEEYFSADDGDWEWFEEEEGPKLSKRERKIVSEIRKTTPRDKIAKKLGIKSSALDTAICRIKKKYLAA
jgi:RNA polymerase sigma factor (sigma-70 family)